MKTVYLFGKDIGNFAGRYDAHESPLEPGIYITPESSTEIAPPAIVAGETLQWLNAAWLIVQSPPPAPAPPWDSIKATLLDIARADREKIIGRLNDAAGRLHRSGVLADALLCDAAADQLANLPKRADVVAAATAVQFQSAVDAGYIGAQTGLSPAGKNAFKELDK